MDLLTNIQYFQPSYLTADNSSWLTAQKDAFTSIKESNKAATEKLSELEMQIAALPLNEQEDGYRAQLLQQLQNVAKENSTGLGLGTSYNAIVKEFGNILKNPELMGKLKNEQDYQAYRKQVLDDKNLSADEKEFILSREGNQYRAQLKYGDDNQTVIGVQRWEPGYRFAEAVDLNKLFDEALKDTAIKKYGSDGYEFVDAQGNITKDITKANNSIIYNKKSNVIEKIKKDDLTKAVAGKIMLNTKAANYIKQRYDMAKWWHNENPDEVDENGISKYGYRNGMTESEYAANLFGQSIDAATYRNVVNSSTIGFIPKATMEAQRSASANGAATEPQLGFMNASQGISRSNPISFMYSRGQAATNNIEGAKYAIVQDMTSPLIGGQMSKEDGVNYLKFGTVKINMDNPAANDKTRLIDAISTSALTEDQKQRLIQTVGNAFDNYYENQSIYNQVIEEASNGDEDLAKGIDLLFNMDSSNFDLLSYGEVGKAINDNKVEFFKDRKGNDLEQKTITIHKNVLKNLEDNGIDLSNYGINVDDSKGGPFSSEVTIPNNDRAFMALVNYLGDDITITDMLTGVAPTVANAILSGPVVGTFMQGADVVRNIITENNYATIKNSMNQIKSVKNIVDKEFEGKTITLSNQNIGTGDVINEYVRGQLNKFKTSEYNLLDKDATELVNSLLSGASISQIRAFGLNEDTGTLTDIQSSSDRQSVNKELFTAISKKGITYNMAHIPGIGTGINVRLNTYNSAGTKIENTKDYFLVSPIFSNILSSYDSKPSTQAADRVILANETSGQRVFLTSKYDTPSLGNQSLIANGDGTFTYQGLSTEFKNVNLRDAIDLKEAMLVFNNTRNQIVANYIDLGTVLSKQPNQLNPVEVNILNTITQIADVIVRITGADQQSTLINVFNDLTRL